MKRADSFDDPIELQYYFLTARVPFNHPHLSLGLTVSSSPFRGFPHQQMSEEINAQLFAILTSLKAQPTQAHK